MTRFLLGRPLKHDKDSLFMMRNCLSDSDLDSLLIQLLWLLLLLCYGCMASCYEFERESWEAYSWHREIKNLETN